MELYKASDNLIEPISKAHEWIQEAQQSGVALPHAMNISSINFDGRPSSRMVLLKRIGQEEFVFFTDYDGNKGKQIIESPLRCFKFLVGKNK